MWWIVMGGGWIWTKVIYLSKHLILILQCGQPLFKLRVFLLQVFSSGLQFIQVSLFPLPCLLCWNSVPQQPSQKAKQNPNSPICHWSHMRTAQKKKGQNRKIIWLNPLWSKSYLFRRLFSLSAGLLPLFLWLPSPDGWTRSGPTTEPASRPAAGAADTSPPNSGTLRISSSLSIPSNKKK